MLVQVLVIVAASHLDAVTFQICSQSFKIMPTALFAVWLLGQYLTPMQWASLPVLAIGVVLVTMNGSTGTPASISLCHIPCYRKHHLHVGMVSEHYACCSGRALFLWVLAHTRMESHMSTCNDKFPNESILHCVLARIGKPTLKKSGAQARCA